MAEIQWKEGFHANPEMTNCVIKVQGSEALMFQIMILDFPDIEPIMKGSWKVGDFGPAKKEVQDATGKENYNFELSYGEVMTQKGVIDEDGTKIVSWGFSNSLETIEFLTEEDLQKIDEGREDIKNPSCPYKVQPENQGKFIWLTGPPGAGKSTTAQLMGKKSGYVYYEGDCTMNFLNPFVPVDVENPTVAAFGQKPLKVNFKNNLL